LLNQVEVLNISCKNKEKLLLNILFKNILVIVGLYNIIKEDTIVIIAVIGNI